jgi:hypothetical protein
MRVVNFAWYFLFFGEYGFGKVAAGGFFEALRGNCVRAVINNEISYLSKT